MGETAILVLHITGKTKLGIFVESFEQLDTEGVRQSPVFGVVVGAAQCKICVFEEGCIFRCVGVKKLMLLGTIIESPDETGNRHICAADN